MPMPATPKIYHIVHMDRLASILSDGCLWCDAAVEQHASSGTTIGMPGIKQRRRAIRLNSHSGLRVGDCVPFYFCTRSVMLYVIHMANHLELAYRGGQQPIVHLEADLREAVAWADRTRQRWAFTLSNAGSNYFEDRCELAQLNDIDWDAVGARDWVDCKEEKQAEFLVEQSFPWTLVRCIGVYSNLIRTQVCETVQSAHHQPDVKVMRNWYY